MQFTRRGTFLHKLMTKLKLMLKHYGIITTATCILFKEVIGPRILLRPLQQQIESGLPCMRPG